METLLKETGSCGRFQTLLILSANITKFLFAFFMLFMSFGNYNPGWRCLDNDGLEFNASAFNNASPAIENDTYPTYSTDNCDLHESCGNVEYDPSASTIITEWNLSCGRSWISSVISSSQMVGMLIGSYFSGYMGDRLGRKYTLMAAILTNVVINMLIIFTPFWPMYVVLKILSGICNSTYRFLPVVYCTEFVSPKWRVAVVSFPFYSVGAIMFAVLAMVTKDWRQIHIIIVCATAFCFMIMLWLPRSIRWLATHDKRKEVFKTAKKIAQLNGRALPSENTIENLIWVCNTGSAEKKKHALRDLFRKGVKLYTCMIGVIFFTIGLTFYVLSFGIKSLPGNLYHNLIIVCSVSLCANAGAIFVGDRLGRRKSYFLFFIVMTFSLFGTVITIFVAPDTTENKGILALALIARACAAGAVYISITVMNELFPTVIRGSINGWANFCMQTGATVAPFLAPNEKSLIYVSYLVLGVLTLFCTCFYFLIPETSGVQLQDTWMEVVNSKPETEVAQKSQSETEMAGMLHPETEVAEKLQPETEVVEKKKTIKMKYQLDDPKSIMTNNVELIECQTLPII